MLGLSTLSGSNAESPHHVYELRLYHVNEGKMNALRDRFGNYTDAIFKRHNMKSIGYWLPEDAPSSQNLFIYILEHPPANAPRLAVKGRRRIGLLSKPIRNGRRGRPNQKRTGRWWTISAGISWIQPAFQP